jgi:hypothetical protein
VDAANGQSHRDNQAGPRSSPRRICDLCVEMLPISGAGISMVSDTGNRGVVCATDDVAAQIEDLQVTLGEGPCIDAVSTGRPVILADVEWRDGVLFDRWPAFMEAAAAAGVRALFAFPLRIGAISVGALDLYRDTPGPLAEKELAAALLSADAAAVALLDLDGESQTLAEFGGAEAHRLQVHQATGMVKVQLDVSIEDAFLALRARAFAIGSSLVDLSTDVVERRVRFSVEDQ